MIRLGTPYYAICFRYESGRRVISTLPVAQRRMTRSAVKQWLREHAPRNTYETRAEAERAFNSMPNDLQRVCIVTELTPMFL